MPGLCTTEIVFYELSNLCFRFLSYNNPEVVAQRVNHYRALNLFHLYFKSMFVNAQDM